MRLSLDTEDRAVTIVAADNVLTLDEMLGYVADLLRGHGYVFDGRLEVVDDDEPSSECD
jgi:hypothetical protein